MYLVADIGGTKLELALARMVGATPEVETTALGRYQVNLEDVQRFPTEGIESFSALLEQYLRGRKPQMAVIGVAGPVTGRQVHLTNVGLTLDADEIESRLGISAILINDLEAHGWGISAMGDDDFEIIQQGVIQAGNRAMVAAGTGLGEAILFWDGTQHRPSPSEGGHTSFAPGNLDELDLLRFMLQRYEHVSWERVVSGIDGFRDIFAFLYQTQRIKVTQADADELFSLGPAIGPALTQKAHQGVAYATKVVEWFVGLYGAEAGNLALKAMSLGGVYLGGSIVHHILPWIRRGDFVNRFVQKGRFRPLLEKMPIRVIKDPHSALKGAGVLAYQLANPEN